MTVKQSLALWGLLGLSACTYPVLATMDKEDEPYHGEVAPSFASPTGNSGTITMHNASGKICNGSYHYLNSDLSPYLISLTGVGAVRCSDGSSASFRFRSISKTTGYGNGTTSKGQKLNFTYGMNEDEARAYLSMPAESSEETGTPNQPNQPDGAQAASKSEPIPISSGTAFFIADSGYLLTNNHVVDGCDYMQMILPNGDQLRGTAVFTDSINDLAVVKVNYRPTTIASFPASSNYRAGDDILAFGFALGSDLASSGVLTTGTIGALSGIRNDSRYMQVTATLQHGNSGGPLIDRFGNVIGINTQGIDAVEYYKANGITPEPANFSVKEMVIKTFLKSNAVPFVENTRTQVKSTADLGEEMKGYSTRAMCYGHPNKTKKKAEHSSPKS